MSGYFVGSDEVACRLSDRGISSENIHITGIPIMPVFSKKLDKKKIQMEMGLDPKRKTALLMSGGCGIGSIDEVSERLLKGNQDLQIIALAGRNEKLLESLQKIADNYLMYSLHHQSRQ